MISRLRAMMGSCSSDHSYATQQATDALNCIRRACYLSGLSGCYLQ